VNVIVGDDGRARCPWSASDAEYRRYHDEEWGFPLHGDQALFEKLSLEGFQAGLSWITILRRRPAFRAAFHNFDIARVAAMDETRIDEHMLNSGIIRNRAKITATITNARVAAKLLSEHAGALEALIWSFAPPPRSTSPLTSSDLPPFTPESMGLSSALRALGFRFVGPTTVYALMQSAGLVNDHLVGCWRLSAPAT